MTLYFSASIISAFASEKASSDVFDNGDRSMKFLALLFVLIYWKKKRRTQSSETFKKTFPFRLYLDLNP